MVAGGNTPLAFFRKTLTIGSRMTRSVGAAGLERIELQRLTERIGRLLPVLQGAAEGQLPAVAGPWSPPRGTCGTAKAIYIRRETPGGRAASRQLGCSTRSLPL